MSDNRARQLYEALERRGALHRACLAAQADAKVADDRVFELMKARGEVGEEIRRLEDDIAGIEW